MSARPWFYFFPGDWQSDTGLRMTSLAAQGLWINLLCLMHGAEPPGHLVFGGKPLGVPQIAKLIGADVDEVEALVAELERNGVFDRAADGAVVSRKMVRDSAKSAIQSANAKARWSAKPTGGAVGNANGNANPDAKSMPHMGMGLGLEDSLLSESAAAGSSNRALAKPSRVGADPVFDQAWATCTDIMRRRSSKSKSLDAWRAAIKRASPASILAALKLYRAKDADVQRTGGPGLHVWLNDSRWEGWIQGPAAVVAPVEITPDILARRLRHYRDTGEWKPAWGEQPRDAA